MSRTLLITVRLHEGRYHGRAIQWLRSAMTTRMTTTAASSQAPLRCSLVESTATATSKQMPNSVYITALRWNPSSRRSKTSALILKRPSLNRTLLPTRNSDCEKALSTSRTRTEMLVRWAVGVCKMSSFGHFKYSILGLKGIRQAKHLLAYSDRTSKGDRRLVRGPHGPGGGHRASD